MCVVGVNIGALTVKVAVVRGGTRQGRVEAHQGRPDQVLRAMLAGAPFAGARFYGVSGPRGHLSEAAAIQRALGEVDGAVDAVVSLGGESFLVYLVVDGRLSHVLSPNQCAAGSGEFLVQQVGRMGLTLEAAVRQSFDGRVVPLASRCSVHCKSDITHKLNRHEATVADVLHTLHDAMANKIVALLEQGQGVGRRVLLIGGVTRNAALLAALRAKRPDTEFVVLPESPWLEAWGSALLARDDPRYRSPQIAPPPLAASLPPLRHQAHRVRVIAAAPRPPPPDEPLVLGVDAGSTTTKAVLLAPATGTIVASHYGRTRGDPVAATRACLRALIAVVGNHGVGLVGATGSARELVGAYLGTSQVYNEISAQAAGAAHFDPDVDTIFEVGGQDAKFIRLRQGVPIEYAMNNACSAGTGSFLEESAQGDLGIDVTDIAALALAAPAPVSFKATCAAFINSDIRLAQQQGQARENIVAGLVYAIAANYLTKVKGSRPVGRKVFLQGGVALNRAVGYAFAHRVGRPVVIPPDPELLGAFGVGLLARDRAAGRPGPATDLATLAAADLQLVGSFTCKACELYCPIDRFEVTGRRFPFGGRCSLFENVWKQRARTTPAPDLVAQRAALVFGGHRPAAAAKAIRIGIPRALTTHSLFPLYATFFARLGLEVVLSGVDPQGDLKSYAGFCFPAQIAHGAVSDAARRGVDYVLLPHVVRLPHSCAARDSYLCPITQAGPYFLGKAFPKVHLLSPVLDYQDGYRGSTALVEVAVRQLGIERGRANQAWAAAVQAQTDTETALRALGQQALARVLAESEPSILLAGHSYNAFAPEASQSVGRKLASMGVTAIPADCLAAAGAGPTAWHFPNQILNAVALARQHPRLFLLIVSNFSCTIDAFTQAMLATELGAKPYLILEIDAHTADAGVQTRLEAFLEIARHHRAARPRPREVFLPCRLGPGGRVIRSAGDSVRLTDPRVKLYFPNFSEYHAHTLALAVRWLGLSAGPVRPLARAQLDRGLEHTTGRECLPLPICLGQLLEIHESREPDEIVGFYMIHGGAPCVADAYLGYLERFIADQRLADLFVLDPRPENDHLGFDPVTLAGYLTPAILAADILVEIEHVLRVAGAPGSVEQLRAAWARFVATATSLDQFHAELPAFIQRLAELPRARDPMTCPRVVVTGDFFTRFSPLFMDGVRERYAERGIMLLPVGVGDLVMYGSYDRVAGTARTWGLNPGGRALATACVRAFRTEGKQYLQEWLSYQAQRRAGEYYRRLFRRSGWLLTGTNDVAAVFAKAAEHVSPAIHGETIPTVGQGLDADREGYDGILVIGPFNCLPLRISEAILKPLSRQHGMPLLSYESDGYPVAPAVLRQVDVHIQQVLERAGRHRPG